MYFCSCWCWAVSQLHFFVEFLHSQAIYFHVFLSLWLSWAGASKENSTGFGMMAVVACRSLLIAMMIFILLRQPYILERRVCLFLNFPFQHTENPHHHPFGHIAVLLPVAGTRQTYTTKRRCHLSINSKRVLISSREERVLKYTADDPN